MCFFRDNLQTSSHGPFPYLGGGGGGEGGARPKGDGNGVGQRTVTSRINDDLFSFIVITSAPN